MENKKNKINEQSTINEKKDVINEEELDKVTGGNDPEVKLDSVSITVHVSNGAYFTMGGEYEDYTYASNRNESEGTNGPAGDKPAGQ